MQMLTENGRSHLVAENNDLAQIQSLASPDIVSPYGRLWVGGYFLLGREEVGQFVRHLQAWLDTGSLEIKETECAQG